MQKSKLRIGLLLNGTELLAWQYRMIEIIKDGDYAEISLVAQKTLTDEKQLLPLATRVANNIRAGTFWTAVIRVTLNTLERVLIGKPGVLPDAFKAVDGTKLLAGVQVVKVNPRRRKYSDYIDSNELARIQAHNIDVFIRLGFRILRGEILRSARYGVWSYHHGDNRVNRGGPAGYWEVMESALECGAVLQILTEDLDGGRVLYRSYSSTDDMSLADSRSNVQWKTLHFIPRKLKELQEEGEEIFFATVKEENAHPQFYDRRLYTAPTHGERGVLLWKKLLQKVRRKWDEIFYFKQWFLLYDIREGMSTSVWRLRPIIPPKDRFWADPFIVSRNNKYYVFFEEFLYATHKGHISLIVMNKDGSFEPPVSVLEPPYHLSYPFIFEYESNLYLIPESSSNRTVELYKCTAFPLKWEFQNNLMEDCKAVDTTLFQWQGKWWMFVARSETEGVSLWDELFLYYSDSPLSDNWTPHQLNPVVSDVKSARPAGRLFLHNGHLYRPSQNSSGHYGYGFNLCEITKLTETNYEERIVSRVEPKWDRKVISTHTFNYEDGLTIIDGQMRRRR
ncbi:MAG: hypothetical protein DMG97_15920 [Acidobacteria bacterium]|nr:MAG: hypothetical protein DMG97_15920 [Acidobacteriota bacterium]